MRTISIIGLGYVGLPLAVAFVKKYKVIGFDINNKRIEELKKNYDRTLEVNKEELENIKENIKYTSSLDDLKKAFIHIVTVPIPIDSHKNPDLTLLIIANKVVKLMIHKGHTIKGSKVLVLGITFKENCPDIRNSRVIDVIRELQEFGVNVYDSWVDKEFKEVENELTHLHINSSTHSQVIFDKNLVDGRL